MEKDIKNNNKEKAGKLCHYCDRELVFVEDDRYRIDDDHALTVVGHCQNCGGEYQYCPERQSVGDLGY